MLPDRTEPAPIPALISQPAATQAPEPRRASVTALAAACGEEQARYAAGQPSQGDFGRELFRRAVCERDPAAWEALVGQYRAEVLTWVRRHPAAASVPDHGACVNRVFERFWMAVGPDRFERFPTLAALLQYVKVCVHSVLLDEVRAQRLAQRALQDWLATPGTMGSRPTAETAGISRAAADEVWQIVAAALPDELERRLVYATVVLDLPPRRIRERHPDRYPSVADVYRAKRNAFDRLRRRANVQRALEVAPGTEREPALRRRCGKDPGRSRAYSAEPDA